MYSNAVLFWVQIGSILGYIGAIFLLYRLLVAQKDATIETLKEKNDLLQGQLDIAESNSPAVLAERLDKRVQMMEGELTRLSADQDESKEEILGKERTLNALRRQMADMIREHERLVSSVLAAMTPVSKDMKATTEGLGSGDRGAVLEYFASKAKEIQAIESINEHIGKSVSFVQKKLEELRPLYE